MQKLRFISTPLSLLTFASSALLQACGGNAPAPEAPKFVEPSATEAHEHSRHSKTTTESKGTQVAQVTTEGAFLAPLPRAVTSFGAAATSTHLYVLGGYFGTPHAYSKKGQSSDVHRISLSGAGTWEKVASLPTGLQGLAAVTDGEKVCHFGGNHATNADGADPHMFSVSLARCLDTKSGTWTNLPDLPEGRSSHGAALVGNTVYVLGGWRLTGDASSGKFATDAFSLDLGDPEAEWKTLPMPLSRRALGVVAVGGKIVVVGGMTSDGTPSKEVDIYDPETGMWDKGPEHPGDAFGVAVTSRDGTVFASGREGILRSLRLGESVWNEVRSLIFPRFFHELRAVGDDIVVVGGISGMHARGRTRIVERLPLDGSLAYGQLTFDTPGGAKNRQGLLASGPELYLFGGNLSLGQHDFDTEHFTNEGWKLDLSTLTFVQGAPFPLRRQSMQSVATEMGGLALGGFGHEPQAGPDTEALSHGQVFSYSWDADAWQEVGKLPRGRTQFGLALRGDEIWIFGGLNYDPSRKQSFDHDRTIWVSRDLGRSFQVLDVALPGPRRAFAGAELGGKYFLIGGMKENFQLVDDCLEFEFDTKEFVKIPCPAPRLSGDLVATKDRLYLVGGSVKTDSGLVESRNIEVYDLKARSWSTLDFEIPLSTRHLRAVPHRDGILLLSTHNEAGTMTVGFVSP